MRRVGRLKVQLYRGLVRFQPLPDCPGAVHPAIVHRQQNLPIRFLRDPLEKLPEDLRRGRTFPHGVIELALRADGRQQVEAETPASLGAVGLAEEPWHLGGVGLQGWQTLHWGRCGVLPRRRRTLRTVARDSLTGNWSRVHGRTIFSDRQANSHWSGRGIWPAELRGSSALGRGRGREGVPVEVAVREPGIHSRPRAEARCGLCGCRIPWPGHGELGRGGLGSRPASSGEVGTDGECVGSRARWGSSCKSRNHRRIPCGNVSDNKHL